LAWWKQRLQGFDFVPVSVCDGKAVYRVDFLRPDKDGKQAREWKELWKVAPDQDYAPSVAQAGSFMPELFGYPGLPVPSQQFAATLERAPKEGPADTLLLTARAAGNLPPNAFGRSRYWIDPQHSYITLQFAHDELHGPAPDADGALRTESYVMERLEQTPSGIWYPTIVRRKNCVSVGAGGKLDTDMVTRFYLDFEAKLPDRLFDAAERER